MKAVNIGGMRFCEGEMRVTNFISVNDEDVQSFVKLAYLGIKLEIRQVPTDPKN